MAKFEMKDGSYGYVCTRAEMANLPSPKFVRYRCVRCGSTTTSRKEMDRHVRWRWLTDWRRNG